MHRSISWARHREEIIERNREREKKRVVFLKHSSSRVIFACTSLWKSGKQKVVSFVLLERRKKKKKARKQEKREEPIFSPACAPR
jgi:hypothetical protein